MSYIIYPQENGQIAVIIPADASLSIEQIAEKDVPKGSPYKIVESINIDDRFFNCYEFDETLGSQLNFQKAKDQQNAYLNQLTYQESAHRAIKTLSGFPNTPIDSDWNTLVSNARSAINSSLTLQNLVDAVAPVESAIAANADI